MKLYSDFVNPQIKIATELLQRVTDAFPCSNPERFPEPVWCGRCGIQSQPFVCGWEAPGAVSYTHLDVYKRQAVDWLNEEHEAGHF